MGQHTTTSERLDELPLLIYGLKQMRVDVIIDSVLGPPHGNWEGLSYGEVAQVFIAHVVIRCTHFRVRSKRGPPASHQPEPGPGETGPCPRLY